MHPIKSSMSAYPPIFNNVILSSTVKRVSSVQFTTTPIKVNNNTTISEETKHLSVNRSRSCLALSTNNRPNSSSASVRSISTSETTRETAANLLSRMRTARNTVDMAMFGLNGVSSNFIKSGATKKSMSGTLGQILSPKRSKCDPLTVNLDSILDDHWSVKNLGYALKCERLDDEPSIPGYMFKDSSLPTFSNLMNESSIPPFFNEDPIQEVTPEVRDEVKAMVSGAVASAKRSYSKKWENVSPKLEDEFDTLGSLLASNNTCENWPVLNVEGNTVDVLPMFKEASNLSTGSPGQDCICSDKAMKPNLLLPQNPADSVESKPHFRELKKEPDETLAGLELLDGPHEIPLVPVEMTVQSEEIRPVVYEESSKNWADAIVGFSPSDVIWKTVILDERYQSFRESKVKGDRIATTKVKPRSEGLIGNDDPKGPVVNIDIPRSPSTHPNSILNIIDAPNRTGVFIQTDLYITNHILDELKKDKDPQSEKSTVPKVEAVTLYEDDSNLIDRHEEFLSLDDLSLPVEKSSVLFNDVISPPATSNRSMSSKNTTSHPPPPRKTPNVDVNVETIIKCFRDRNQARLSVTEFQKYVDSRLPYPFCTESNLEVTGSNEALSQGVKAVEKAKTKLVTFGKPNETSSTIRGNVHLNHMLSDIPTNEIQQPKDKKTVKTVPIHSVNPIKKPQVNELTPEALQSKLKRVLEVNPPENLSESKTKSVFREDGIQVLTSRMMQKMFGDDPDVKSKSKFIMKPSKSSSPVLYKGFKVKSKGLEEKIAVEKWEVRNVKEDFIEMTSGRKKKLIDLAVLNKFTNNSSQGVEKDGSLTTRDKRILRNIIRGKLQRALGKSKASHKPKVLAKKDKTDKTEGMPIPEKLEEAQINPKEPEKEMVAPAKNQTTWPNLTSSTVAVDSIQSNRFISSQNSSVEAPTKSNKPVPSSLFSQPDKNSPSTTLSDTSSKPTTDTLKSDEPTVLDDTPESEIIIIPNDNPAAKPQPKPSTREIIYIINDANKPEEPPKPVKTEVDPEKPQDKSCSEGVEAKKEFVIINSKKYGAMSKHAISLIKDTPVLRSDVQRSKIELKDTILEKGVKKDKEKNIIDLIKETSTGESTIGRVPDLGTLVPDEKRKIDPTPSHRDELKPKKFTPAGMFMGGPRIKPRVHAPSPIPTLQSDPVRVKPSESVRTKIKNHSRQAPLSTVIPLGNIVDFPLVNPALSPNPVREAEMKILSINVHKDPELRLKLATVPSVTKVLNATMAEKSKLALLRWRKNMIAQLGDEGFLKYYAEQLQKGTDFHAAVQQYLLKKHDAGPTGAVIDNTNLPLLSLTNVLKDVSDVRVLESHVVHPKLQYRGVIDCVAKYRDRPVLIEWKRSEKPKPTVKHTYDAPIQMSAYIGAMNFDNNYEIPVSGGLVVIAYSDGSPADTYQISLKECQKYWKLWLERLKEFLSTKTEVEDK